LGGDSNVLGVREAGENPALPRNGERRDPQLGSRGLKPESLGNREDAGGFKRSQPFASPETGPETSTPVEGAGGSSLG